MRRQDIGVETLAPRHWRRDVGAKTLVPRHSRSSNRAHAGDYAFACSWSICLFVVMVVELIAADASSPGHHRRFFVSGLCLFICFRASKAARQGGRQTFRAFGKQLTALLAKILALQAIILAF